jgi:hypothetical protein
MAKQEEGYYLGIPRGVRFGRRGLLRLAAGGLVAAVLAGCRPSEQPPVSEAPAAEATEEEEEATPEKGPPVIRRDFLTLEEGVRPILSLEDNSTQVTPLELPKTVSAERVINTNSLTQVGLSETYAQRIVSNLPAYREAGRQMGVDWKVLAAFNGVETNFRSDICTTSTYCKYGPLQVVGANYRQGAQLTFDQFVYHLVSEAGKVMKQKAQAVGAHWPPSNMTEWAKIAYAYNGMPSAKTGPDGKTYYGGSGDYWYRSGYVANNWTNPTNGQTYRSMYVLGWGGSWVRMDRDGFLALWTKLAQAEKLAG